jgi:hypothetical protein
VNDDDILEGLRGAAREELSSADEASLDDVALARMVRAAEQAQGRPAKGRARAGVVVAIATLFAAAAAAVFVARAPTTDAAIDAPRYAIEISGGQESARGEVVATRARAHASDPLRVIARPDVDARAPMHASVASVRGVVASASSADIRVSASGAVEVTGTVGALVGAAPGEATLVVVVAPATMPIDVVAIASGAAAPKGAAIVRATVQVLPP